MAAASAQHARDAKAAEPRHPRLTRADHETGGGTVPSRVHLLPTNRDGQVSKRFRLQNIHRAARAASKVWLSRHGARFRQVPATPRRRPRRQGASPDLPHQARVESGLQHVEEQEPKAHRRVRVCVPTFSSLVFAPGGVAQNHRGGQYGRRTVQGYREHDQGAQLPRGVRQRAGGRPGVVTDLRRVVAEYHPELQRGPAVRPERAVASTGPHAAAAAALRDGLTLQDGGAPDRYRRDAGAAHREGGGRARVRTQG